MSLDDEDFVGFEERHGERAARSAANDRELAIEGDPFVYSLTVDRCIEIAGMPESCDTQALSNLPGTGGVRFGYDPSMYAVGENHYRFRLELRRGAEIVDEALLDLQVTVTSCMECVGS